MFTLWKNRNATDPVKLKNPALLQGSDAKDESKMKEVVLPNKDLIRRLLECVKQADKKGIDEIMRLDPNNWTLMFCSTSHTLADGKTQEITTPLRYAAKIYDTYSRKQFSTYVPDENRMMYLEHLRAQKVHIDLEPLFNAYIQYESLFQKFLTGGGGDAFSSNRLDAFWSTQHGQRIREIVIDARHFINELSRKRGKWNKDAKFDNLPAPHGFKVYDVEKEENVSLNSVIPKLGVSHSLIGPSVLGWCKVALHPFMWGGAKVDGHIVSLPMLDFLTLRSVLEARKKDLDNEVSVSPSVPVTQRQKR